MSPGPFGSREHAPEAKDDAALVLFEHFDPQAEEGDGDHHADEEKRKESELWRH